MVLDVGCGPRHVGRYLADHGVETGGVDLSPEMVRIASQLHPMIPFAVGDRRVIPARRARLGGITAFYSLIHLSRPDLPAAFREPRRVLRDDAPLLVAVHGGEGGLHADEFLGRAVSLDATLIGRDELASLLEASGFRVEHIESRHPYPFEHPTERLYGLAYARRADTG